MEIRDSISHKGVRAAQKQFEKAEEHLDSALKHMTRERDPSYSNRFFDAQRILERSTKAVFELMDVQYPRDHAIDPTSEPSINLLNSISAEINQMDRWSINHTTVTREELERWHTGEVARLLFLSYMYGNVYTLVSYGIDEPGFSLPADDFVRYGDMEYAIEHAVAGIKIADVVIDSIATGELSHTDPPNGTGPLEKRSAVRSDFYGVTLPERDYDPVADYRRKL